MIDGTINLHRRVLEHPLFDDGEPFTRREAWIWLIATAAFRPMRADWQGTKVLLQRGQLVASTRHLAKAWGWQRPKVQRFLKRLEAEGMIVTEPGADPGANPPPNRITLCNYEDYQPRQGRADPGADTTPDPQKKEGSKEETPSGRARTRESGQGQRLPDDWQPKTTHHHLAQQLGITTEAVAYEADKFRDHWSSASGQNARKRDWDRAFNNWLRKSAEYGKRTAARQQALGYGRGAGSTVAAVRDLLHGTGG